MNFRCGSEKKWIKFKNKLLKKKLKKYIFKKKLNNRPTPGGPPPVRKKCRKNISNH